EGEGRGGRGGGGGSLVRGTAETRMSGVDLNGTRIRKGGSDSIDRWVEADGGTVPPELEPIVDRIATSGGTPLVVATNKKTLGVVYLKDVVKEGLRERFAELRAMGI